MLKFNPGNTTGTLVSPLNLISASGVAIDNSSNLYVANIFPATNATELSSYLQKESTAGVAAGAPFPIISPCTYEMQYLTLDGSYNIWTSNQYQGNSPNFICRYSSSGTLQYSFAYPGAAFPLSYGLAIDAGGNAWFSDKDNNAVYKIAAGTSTLGNTACNAAAGCTQAAGGTIATPFSAAVDGANNVWFSNSVSGSLVSFGNNAVALTPTYLGGVSGYTPNVLSLMVDQSGSVWGNSYTANTLVQYIGLAAPTAQPLSYARANNKLGARP
jgi:streptogramin lyase